MEHILKCHEFLKDDIVRGDNCYLYDKNNRRYVDFESGIWCTVVGHNNRRLNQKITEQIGRVMHLGYRYTNRLAEEAAVQLLNTFPLKDGKCVFLCSGTEAVEFGINSVRLLTGKKMMLTFSESYLGAYGYASMRNDFWIKVDFNRCFECKETECLKDCSNLKEVDTEEIGGFVFEPGSSSGKVRFPPHKLIDLLVREIRNSKGLILVNEVTTGFGRTGKWYGFDHYGIRPDMVAVGKGLGNGYPVSAVVMKKELGEKLEYQGYRYVQSHQNDPLGCVIATEVIRIMSEDDLVNRSFRLGEKFLDHLNELKRRFSCIKEVRGRGLMVAVEFTKVDEKFNVQSIAERMLEKGFIIGYNPDANLIRFLPALTIEEKEIENLVENLSVVLKK
ncbi:MAG: hypothetical protein AMJ90_10065 [candidate division Zixibacteria bacterium SM23_73_2]|nr:MAG: hypothetical protein AMJ90_10065 [candidate division Zixibacteria bacterium SM23_73_2]